MTTDTSRNVQGTTAPTPGIARRIRAAFHALAREAGIRRAAAQVARLDDRLLADLGISRDGIEAAVRYGRSRR